MAEHATNPVNAVKLLFKNYTNYRGIATRADFWWAELATFLIVFVLSIFVGIFNDVNASFLAGLASLLIWAYLIAIFIPVTALYARHARGIGLHGGWLVLVTVLAFCTTIGTVILFAIPNKVEEE